MSHEGPEIGSVNAAAPIGASLPPARAEMGAKRHALRCLVGALLGIAVAFVPLAQYTCVLILLPDSPMLLQKLPPDGQPLPAQLAWSPWLYRLLIAIGGMPMAGALGIYIALAACGAYVAMRAINPTFRVTTGVDWDRTLLFRTYMHTAPLIKVVVTSVPSFVVAFALYALLRMFVPGSAGGSAYLAGAVFGATAWIALSRDGFIGDCDSGNYQLPQWRTVFILGLRGAAVGVSVWLVISAASEASAERLIRLAVALGGAGESAWWGAATASLALGALAGGVLALAVGLMRDDSGQPARSASDTPAMPDAAHATTGRTQSQPCRHGLRDILVRFGLLGATVGCYVLVAGAWLPAQVRRQYDFDLRTGAEVRPSWWRPDRGGPRSATLAAVGRETPDAGEGTTTEWIVSPIEWSGASGLDLGPASMQRLAALLARRGERTVLQRPAAVARYDRACLELDLPERLRVLVRYTRSNGDPEFARLLIEDLALLAGAPEAKEPLTALGQGVRRGGASPLFIFPTDDARIPVGDIFASHGDPDAARRWYEDGGMPAQRATERAARLVRVSRSDITGSITLPSTDWVAKVGLFPAYGSLGRRIMAADSARKGVDSMDAMEYPAARPAIGPFALRDVIRVGQPDPHGRFAIRNVQAGAYRLVVWLRSAAGDRKARVSVSSDIASAGLIECNGYADVPVGQVRVAAIETTAGSAPLRYSGNSVR